MSGITPEMLDGMLAAGLTQEQMVTILKAHLAAEEARKAEKREKDAQRKRRSRANQELSRNVTVTPRDTADNADTPPLSPPLSPEPPNSPPISPRSEPNGSGVAALQSTLAENVIVLTDPRADLFGRGLRLLAGMTGKPEGQLRSLLGKWLKAAQDDAVKVLRLIEDAARDKRAEPVAWIEAALKAPPPQGQQKPAWVLEQEKMRRWL